MLEKMNVLSNNSIFKLPVNHTLLQADKYIFLLKTILTLAWMSSLMINLNSFYYTVV